MTDVTATVPVDVGHPLAPYFPRLAIEWIRSSPEQLQQELEGTIAFVDISGFTKLSERLARLGKSGAEELTATIDTCFVTLLDLAVANGGRLLKFGGDALLVYFSGEAHEARACLAAIEMRRALPRRRPPDRAGAEGLAADVGGRAQRPVQLLPGRRVPSRVHRDRTRGERGGGDGGSR